MSTPASLLASGCVAAAFATVHVLGSRLTFLRMTPRSLWLSGAGGVSVAYVFVHILPELAEHQRQFAQASGGPLAVLEHHVYLVALVGLIGFYGLERLARRARRVGERNGSGRAASPVFWTHVGAFAIYNALIGYLLLHRYGGDAAQLAAFATALGLHFVVNDQALREHHGPVYDSAGRWVLAVSPIVGWMAGVAWEVDELAIGVLFALLAGSIVMNVLKEELPEERESRFAAFAGGAAAYSALLLGAA